MTIVHRRRLVRPPASRTAAQVWAVTRPNVLRWLFALAVNKLHAADDAEAAAFGLEVVWLPGGQRAVRDPRVAGGWPTRRRIAAAGGRDADDAAILRGAVAPTSPVPTPSRGRARNDAVAAAGPARGRALAWGGDA